MHNLHRRPLLYDTGSSQRPLTHSTKDSTSTTSSPQHDDCCNEKTSKQKFRSHRLMGRYEQPWLEDPRMRKTRQNSWIVYGGIALGVLLSVVIWVLRLRTVTNQPLCLILDDDFHTLDPDIWTHEVQLDGYGTGSFDWTTTDPSNAFTDAEGLHIVPTLTNETTNITKREIYNGYTLNLTKAGGDGSCTSTSISSCSIRSNDTAGTIIPPVRSARLTTVGKKTIKYGKTEVTAKLPKGDWLWPAIWMFPQKSVYGQWPRSGEIDIAEVRGNNYTYVVGGVPEGRNSMQSTLHWGPTADTDAYWRTTDRKTLRRTDFTDEFHTFGLEWSQKYLYIYLDSRLVRVLFVNFPSNEDVWQRGGFSTDAEDTMFVDDPWRNTTDNNAPFNQEFYLILNVAVGSQNGWFPYNAPSQKICLVANMIYRNGVGGKPWIDDSPNAASDFWNAADQWLPTWGDGNDRGMTVKNVKMWQQGAC